MTFGRERNETGPYYKKAVVVAVLIMILNRINCRREQVINIEVIEKTNAIIRVRLIVKNGNNCFLLRKCLFITLHFIL